MRRLLTLVIAAALIAALTGGSSASAARTCTPDDLQGSRAPAMLNDHGLDTQDEPLIAGTGYRVVVVRELAITDSGGDPDDSTISVTAPSGPALTPTTQDGRPAYAFTPASAGSVRLVVSWDETFRSGDRCSASQSFDIPVLAPTAPTITGKFRRGGSFGSSFVVGLTGRKPQDPTPINMIVRVRKGTTKPPPPRGHALGTFTFEPTGFPGFETSSPTRRFGRVLTADTDPSGKGVQIYPYNNIAFGRTLRFAFSIEVTQGGRRLGGMRSGAACKRKQFSGHSAVRCRAVGLKHRP